MRMLSSLCASIHTHCRSVLMTEYAAPRGTRDMLPSETPKRRYIESMF